MFLNNSLYTLCFSHCCVDHDIFELVLSQPMYKNCYASDRNEATVNGTGRISWFCYPGQIHNKFVIIVIVALNISRLWTIHPTWR